MKTVVDVSEYSEYSEYSLFSPIMSPQNKKMKLFTTNIHTTQIKIITILIIGTGATQKAAQETWAIVKTVPLMENVAPNLFSIKIFHKTIVKD